MNRKIKLFILAGFFSFALNSQAMAFSVSYDQKVVVGKDTVATVKVMVQDNQMWAQSNFSGIDSVILRNEAGSYSYVPAQKMATKIPASMDRPNLTRDLARFNEFLKQNEGKKIGTETIDGKNCDIYTFKEPTLKHEAKAWVWTEKQFPLKIEVPAPEGLTLVELSNIQFDPKIPENQFQLPADVKVIDLEATQAVNAEDDASQALPDPNPEASPAAVKQ